MRVAFVSEWFSESMGYSDNNLPKALAALGVDVHLLTTNTQPYFYSPFYSATYEPFIGPGVVPVETKRMDGYTLHRLPHINIRGRLGMHGLHARLKELRPDVVQVTSHVALASAQAAAAQPLLKFRMFTANHVVASVFPPKSANYPDNKMWTWKLRATTGLPGRIISSRTVRCYAATVDAAEVAHTFFGVPRDKLSVVPLGVDTALFAPLTAASSFQRKDARAAYGFADDELVCVYSGRFSRDKDPACLARAIGQLRVDGHAVRGLFVGSGEQEAEIKSVAGCLVTPFLPFRELPSAYRAADVGVWPRQESMSMLDASASGLPVVVSRNVQARERVDGIGLTYDEGDAGNLARVLSDLLDPSLRARLGSAGARRMAESFSWRGIAERRLHDYESSLSGRPL